MTTITQKLYEQVPPGTHAARLYKIADLGTCNTAYGPKEQVELTFITSAKGSTGEPLFVRQLYTKSLHLKSKLRQHLTPMLRGNPMPLSVELESFIGVDVLIVVNHHMGKDGLRSWAHIEAVLPAAASVPPPPNTPPPASLSFTVAPPQEVTR